MRAIIAAAGTGGHINPGIAIANKMKEKEPDSEIIFIGTNRGLEHDLVSRAGYKLETIEAYGLQRKLSIENIKQMISTIKSVSEAKKIIKEFKPDVIVGTGGYICGPVFFGKNINGIPKVIHESNAYPGKAVKMLEKKVDKIFVGFEETRGKLLKAKEVIVTGTPTKLKKITLEEDKRKEILKEFNIKNDLPIVLVFGGSQGAQRINETIQKLLEEKLNEKYQIIWATGIKQFDIIKEKYEKANILMNNIQNVKIVPYIYNMEELMNIADLLVCRSGAMTVTEIAMVGKASILIPLPTSSANRQEDNARVLESLGAGKIILDKELNSSILSKKIDEIVHDKHKLRGMGKAANKIAKYNVEDRIYDEIKKLILTNKE